jgi:competence protein ComEC
MTDSMDMYFLDVGQGDCTFVEVGNADTFNQELYLIDFGYKERTFNGDHPAYQTRTILMDRITKASKARGYTNAPYLDHLFITHPDGDHWNMIYSLITSDLWEKDYKWPKGANLKVGTLTYGAADAEYKKGSAYKQILWDTIKDAATTVTVLRNKHHDKQDQSTGAVTPRWTGRAGKLKIYLISSNFPTKSGGNANPKSLCLIFEFNGFRLLLLGDAEPTTVGDQLKGWYAHNNYAFLRCDVLKLAHHGSRKGTPEWWPELVKPKYAFVSGDYYWSHPYEEALANVVAAGTLNTNELQHWIASSHDDDKDYRPYQSTNAMFSTLWYVVTSNTPVTANDAKGKAHTCSKGQYIGIAWLLQKFEAQAKTKIRFSPENVWPAGDQIPTS